LETANSVVQAVESGSVIAKKILKVNVKRTHKCFGHMNETATCMIVVQLGMELSRTGFGTCKSCAIGKAKQRNIPKNQQLRKQPHSMGVWVMTYLRSKLLKSLTS
jgi:hypothetical protein